MTDKDLHYIKQLPQITADEVLALEKYRKLKDTSVLTIMFTDIKGFTQITEERGEQYSNTLREKHDQLLVPTIEKKHNGLVVKHIGDAIMCVFSEPSTAVRCALDIQSELRKYAANQPDEEPLQVRIGLHMGQVTVENQLKLDLFGRHVNRASRVEGLADGNQIYLTYPVYDSAKGWLGEEEGQSLQWTAHGKYQLKGIKTPIEIYEVSDLRHSKPKPPISGIKVGAKKSPSLLFLLGSLLLGAAITLAIMHYQRTQVFFVKWYPEQTMINQLDKLVLEGNKEQELRQAVNKFKKGYHLFHYDINYRIKYYMEADIKRGKNYIEPNFKESGMPGISRRITLYKRDNYIEKESAKREFNFRFYDKNNQRLEKKAILEITIAGKPLKKDGSKVKFDFNWKVTENDKVIIENQQSVIQKIDEKEAKREKSIIFEDEFHYYKLRTFISYHSAELSIDSGFIDYK